MNKNYLFDLQGVWDAHNVKNCFAWFVHWMVFVPVLWCFWIHLKTFAIWFGFWLRRTIFYLWGGKCRNIRELWRNQVRRKDDDNNHKTKCFLIHVALNAASNWNDEIMQKQFFLLFCLQIRIIADWINEN